MHIEGPTVNAPGDCEQVLRSVPQWFGIEEALQMYAADTAKKPTFLLRDGARVVAFMTLQRKIDAQKTRVHGDLSLFRMINTGKDWSFVDFEGGNEGSIGERTLKRSPLVDVATLLRSTEEAMQLSLTRQRAEDLAALQPWADRWLALLGHAFLSGYRRVARGADFIPGNSSDFALLLDVFLLDDAVRDVAKASESSPEAFTAASHSLFRLLQMPYADESNPA